MTTTYVEGPIEDLDERYRRIVIRVEIGPESLIGGFAVCPFEKPYRALGEAAHADAIDVGDRIRFEIAEHSEEMRFAVGTEVDVLDAAGESPLRGRIVETEVEGPDTWEIEVPGPYYRVELIDGTPGTFAYAESELTAVEAEQN